MTIDPEQAFVDRDESGEILTREVEAPGFGTVKVKSLVYGESLRYQEDADTIFELSPDQIAEIFNRKIVEPNLASGLGKEQLSETDVTDQMKPLAVGSLLSAVFRASGMLGDVYMQDDGSAMLELEEDPDPTKK